MRILKVVFIILFIATPLLSRSIWRDRNIYSSSDALQIGDIVVVVIEDVSQMRFTYNIQNESNTKITSNPDVNITGFLPKVSADKDITNKDEIKLSGNGNLNISVASTVTRQEPNGNYTVQGIKEYVFNGVSSRFTVSGIINPALLNGRKIKSNDITNFNLNIRGYKQGLGLNITRAPLQEGETVKSELTETEKQQIITDYLQKMINELSR